MDLKRLDDIKINFIVGVPRSGTTLLSVLLNQYPNCLSLPEVHQLTYFYKKYKNITTITKTLKEDIYEFHQVTEFSKYDIIINCTPLGGANSSDISPVELNGIRKGILVYDLNYIPIKSKFLMEAEELGALIKNGDAMLKYQGNYAIKIWCSSLNEGGKIFEDFK